MPSYTSDKHPIWILPFIFPSESKPPPPATAGPTNSSSPLLMDSSLDQLNWLYKLDAGIKEFIGRIHLDKRMQQRQYGCRMNQNRQHHHRQENKQENILGFTPTVIKLLPSIINRVPGLPRHNRNSSSSSSLSSSSCFPVPSLESPPTQR